MADGSEPLKRFIFCIMIFLIKMILKTFISLISYQAFRYRIKNDRENGHKILG